MRNKVLNFETSDPVELKSWQKLQDFSTSKQLPLAFNTVAKTNLSELETQVDLLGVRTDFAFSQGQLKAIKAIPADASQTQSFDHWIYEGKQFWGRLIWPVAARELIVAKVGSLDLRESCYIVGEGVRLRVAAWMAASLGYSKLVFVSENLEDMHLQTQKVSRAVVGVKIIEVPADQLTMQTNGCSLLINTVNLEENNSLLGGLAYFNFMRTGGVILDMNSGSFSQPLIDEAKSAELVGLSCWDLQASLDYQFLKILHRSSSDPAGFQRFLNFNLLQFIELWTEV